MPPSSRIEVLRLSLPFLRMGAKVGELGGEELGEVSGDEWGERERRLSFCCEMT